MLHTFKSCVGNGHTDGNRDADWLPISVSATNEAMHREQSRCPVPTNEPLESCVPICIIVMKPALCAVYVSTCLSHEQSSAAKSRPQKAVPLQCACPYVSQSRKLVLKREQASQAVRFRLESSLPILQSKQPSAQQRQARNPTLCCSMWKSLQSQ